MFDTLISIAASIIAAILYDALKKAYANSDNASNTSGKKHSQKDVLPIKKEFYIGFFLGICLCSIPNTKFQFINIAIDVFMYLSFFVALMGFMCLVELVDDFSNNGTNK